ncbi:MAG: dipeptidase [Bacteroidota bacterium]
MNDLREGPPRLAIGILMVIAWLGVGISSAPAQARDPDDDHLAHARRILRSVPLIDGHNDLPWGVREDRNARGNVESVDLHSWRPGDTDIERLKRGQVGGQFWSVYIPGDLPDRHFARMQLEQIDIARRIITRYPGTFAPALTADDIQKVFRQGRIASLLGIEGGHAIENSLGVLRAYYGLGVRYMTLTHNVTLDWADAALDSARHNGLTPFGREVIREMNRLGMLVDLSHVSAGVMSQALDVSEAPVIFSHSSAGALVDVARNVPDSILVRIPHNGGIVMATFVPDFVSRDVAAWYEALAAEQAALPKGPRADSVRMAFTARRPKPRATLSQVADHIDHIRKIAGADNVGIGGDFFGSEDMPIGLEDVSCYPSLFAELLRRRWSDDDLRKLAGLNLLRVMRSAESVAARLQRERRPSNATIELLDRPRP